MQVHCDEGVASHIGPESCAGSREGAGEALTGERAGQPLSRESVNFGCRLVQNRGRQYGGARHASSLPTWRGQRPWHVRMLLAREPGDLQLDPPDGRVVRIGKARSRSR